MRQIFNLYKYRIEEALNETIKEVTTEIRFAKGITILNSKKRRKNWA